MGTVAAANSSGSKNRDTADGIPLSREGEDRPRMPEHAGIGPRLLADVRHGPAVSDSTACRCAGELVPATCARHRPRRRPRRPPAGTSTAHRHQHPGTPGPRPAPPGKGSLQVRRRKRPRHREGEAPRWTRSPQLRPTLETMRPTRSSSRETPMRPINLPAYGKVEVCPRFRRTSSSAASSTR